MVMHIWVFGTHFLKNEQNKPINPKKSEHVLPMIKIQAFKWKLEFWKTSNSHHELDSFLILKDFSDEISSNITNMTF